MAISGTVTMPPRLESIERISSKLSPDPKRLGIRDVLAAPAKAASPAAGAGQEDELRQAVDKANAALAATPGNQQQLQLSVDSVTKQVVVKVVDKATNEVVWQIPAEEALRRLRNVEGIRGLLFESKI